MEKLIKLVKQYPPLYDTNHEGYIKTKLKDSIWKKIAVELKYENGDAAKEQWRKLRDCHRDALRRRRKRSKQGVVVKPWIYQKQMSFLLPFISNRLASTHSDDEDEVAGNDNSNTGQIETTGSGEESDHIVDGNPLFDISHFEDDAVSNGVSTKKKAKFKMEEDDLMNQTSFEGEELNKQLQIDQSINQTQDGLYQFFISMYCSTNSMPLSLQLQIKRKIFNAVTEAEEELISNPQLNSYTSYVQPLPLSVSLPPDSPSNSEPSESLNVEQSQNSHADNNSIEVEIKAENTDV